jgi:hypothetical protein
LEKGYEVNYSVEPKSGANDEYFVYLNLDDKRHFVFSKWSMHAKEGAVIADTITMKNVDSIVEKIEALVGC